ncbi:TPA: NADPH-dependent 7-cyano-7-deazaguanine reductase QueF [Candidatus Poribacteria bacterium]|nr:NADPH-dependent 7-cyano-7-deazaguanine reductase QueF [Candidatus Poribacteria bacterium]
MEIGVYEHLQDDIRDLKTPEIDTWTNQYSDREYTIELTIPEFTCVCPKTGLPDFATIKIFYVPHQKCIELKSFKEYIVFYRNVGIFHEHVVNKILDDFVRACDPRSVKIIGDFNVRGGIKTIVKADYNRSAFERSEREKK